VLRTENDFILLDFEGEPMHSLAERRGKHSPLKDVAGMLRSFSYAAHSSLFDFTRERPEDLQTMAPWASAWEVWVSAEFLREYLETASGAPFLPDDDDQLETLLEAFLLDKAFYELNYELNNRPDWLHIPLQGILELAKISFQDSKP
jgi:maltose alpha-D-glucosyltransferase/alpha-amylase